MPRGHGSIILDHECAPHRQQVPLALPGGRWHGVLCKGFGPDGKRRRYKVSGRTKQDVIEALKKSEEIDTGLSTSRPYKLKRLPMIGSSTGCRSERTRRFTGDALAPLLARTGKRCCGTSPPGVVAGLKSLIAERGSPSGGSRASNRLIGRQPDRQSGCLTPRLT